MTANSGFLRFGDVPSDEITPWEEVKWGDIAGVWEGIGVWILAVDDEVPGELLADEMVVYERYISGLGRETYRATRLAVRWIVGAMTGVAPEAVRIGKSGLGAPFVVGRGDLHLSISHSEGMVAIATAGQAVGVDLEFAKRERRWLELGERYYPEVEAAALAMCQGEDLAAAFLRLWVSKEAALKCLGTGLAGFLERTECQVIEGSIGTARVDGRNFAVREFRTDGGGFGAVAVEGEIDRVRFVRLGSGGERSLNGAT